MARVSRITSTSQTSRMNSPRIPYRRKSSTIFPHAFPTPESSGRRGSIFDGSSYTRFQPDLSASTVKDGTRKFSDEYGHGHVLDDSAIPTNLSAGKKRRSSSTSEKVSPKRVRFSVVGCEDEEQKSDRNNSLTVSDLSAESVQKPYVGRHDLSLTTDFLSERDFFDIISFNDCIAPISISDISFLLRSMQKLTAHFAAMHFADAADESEETVATDMRLFPLEDLKIKHPSLYLTVVNVLDASTDDFLADESILANASWHKFFADPNYRPFLVYAILGEWITQRIFKDPAFGLSAEGRKEMEDEVDKQYIHFDSFVRAKKRSAVVAKHRKMINAENWLHRACHELADELMVVLDPMMPFAKHLTAQAQELTPADAAQKAEIKQSLAEVITSCAVVNLTIVRSGENGTIVRPAHRLEKGKRCFRTAPMELCNSKLLESKADRSAKGADKEIIVKMTCWPRMEGWVPHGLDQQEMGTLQYDTMLANAPEDVKKKIENGYPLTAEEVKAAHSEFCWECCELKNRWELLPGELHRPAKEQSERQQMLRRTYKARAKAEKARREQASDSDEEDDASDVSSDTDNGSTSTKTKDAEEPPRGSWVTEYTCLAPHQVYCEWTKPESFYNAIIAADGTMAGKSIREVNSLDNAIAKARRMLPLPSYLSTASEDLVRKLWDFYASHNLAIEWSTFLIATLVYLSSGSIGDIISAPAKLTSAISDHAGGILSTNTLSEAVLDSATSYLDNNIKVFKAVIKNTMSGLSSIGMQASSEFSAKYETMTHFAGQQQPYTDNPIVKSAFSKAAAALSGAVLQGGVFTSDPFLGSMDSNVNPSSATIRPALAALTSSAAAVISHVTMPLLVAPIDPVARPVITPFANTQDDELIVEVPVIEPVGEDFTYEQSTVEPSMTHMPVTTPLTTVSATTEAAVLPASATETSTVNKVSAARPGILSFGKSFIRKVLPDAIVGNGMTRTRTITVTPGRTYTTVVGGRQRAREME